MGIATVAIYSDADANGEHVAMADEAVWVGPPPSAESYLQAERIIEAAKSTGAEAIHRFGSSENAEFVKALKRQGLCLLALMKMPLRQWVIRSHQRTLLTKRAYLLCLVRLMQLKI